MLAAAEGVIAERRHLRRQHAVDDLLRRPAGAGLAIDRLDAEEIIPDAALPQPVSKALCASKATAGTPSCCAAEVICGHTLRAKFVAWSQSARGAGAGRRRGHSRCLGAVRRRGAAAWRELRPAAGAAGAAAARRRSA